MGSRALASRQAVVTRLSALEDLAGLSLLLVDKPGTLTLPQPVLAGQNDPDEGSNPHPLEP